MRSLSALPGQLEEMYKTCLLRASERGPLCDFLLLCMVCVAPTPMQEQALRQLLALDKDTYDYTEDALISTEDLVLSGVGLVTFDLTDRIVVPIHDSVRSFIFSDSAFSVNPKINHMPYSDPSIMPGMSSTHARELNAKNALGYLCLRHIKCRATRTVVAPADPVRLDVSTTAFSLPSSLQRPLNLLFPRTSRLPTAKARFHSSPRRMAPAEGGFLQYATDNWIECNRKLTQAYCTQDYWRLFAAIALEQNESWNVHPWSAQTPNQHRIEMFAFSVAYGHVPLLKLFLSQQKALSERIVDGLLANHGQLPALHVACKKGHSAVLIELLSVCHVVSRCQQHGRCALHYAAEFGHLNCCHIMAQAKPQLISAHDMNNLTPLHLATQNGHQDVVEFLLRDDNTGRSMTRISRESLLTSALNLGHWHLLDILIGAIEPNEPPIDTEDAANQALSMSDHPRSAERLAIKAAALRLQGHPNDRDENGLTLLWHASATGFARVAQHLLMHPAFDEEKEMHTRNSKGQTALGIACENRQLDVVQVFLNTKLMALSVIRDWLGWLPIESLALHHEALRLVEEDGFLSSHIPTQRDKRPSASPQLVVTVPNDIPSELQNLKSMLGHLAFAADLNDFRDLESFLQAASEVNHVDAVRHLLLQWENGKVNRPPRTPLLADTYRYLRKRGLSRMDFSSLGIADSTFPVAIYLAAMKQHKEVLQLLLQSEDPSSSIRLMETARQLRSYPGHLGVFSITSGVGGWFSQETHVLIVK